jgi:subtilisin family serine protease
VITVGSINDQGTVPRDDDVINDFSSRGPTIDRLPKPDLVAPGANITSLKPGGGYAAQTGTSMATPMVTGAAALLWEKNPGLTPNHLRNLLVSTAEDRGYNRLIQGAGYLNVAAALEKAVPPSPIFGAPPGVNGDQLFTIFVTLGLKFAKGQRRQDLLTILSNHVAGWLQKTQWFQGGDQTLYQEHLPQIIYAIGERFLREQPIQS